MTVNIVSLLISLASVGLAVFFYLRSRKEKRIAYRHSLFPSRIFDQAVSSPRIRVLDDEGKLIENNIYVTEVTLWNAGDLPIEPDDVRKPLTIEINECNRILDYKVLRETHPEISNVTVNEDSQLTNSTKKRALFVKWDHLDPNFGIEIQIIFTSEGSWFHQIEVGGNIVGVKNFINAYSPVLINRPVRKSTRRLVRLLGISIALLILAGPFIYLQFPVSDLGGGLWLFAAFVMAFACLIFGEYILSRRLKSPFQQQ